MKGVGLLKLSLILFSVRFGFSIICIPFPVIRPIQIQMSISANRPNTKGLSPPKVVKDTSIALGCVSKEVHLMNFFKV